MAPVADQQILRGVTSILTWQNLDGDGEPAAPAGAVTVKVTNSAGETVVPAGTATIGSGTTRSYSLAAASNTKLDLLTATWTDAGDSSTHATLIEVVGAFYFTVTEARLSDPALLNDVKFPTDAIATARRQVEEEFERICDRAFVPRFRTETLRGSGSCVLTLGQPNIRAVRSVDAVTSGEVVTPWTAPELADLVLMDGIVLRSNAGKSFPYGEVRVAYEHGLERPPAEVKRAALLRLRYILSQPTSGLPDRATSFSVAEGGTYSLARASAYSTGIDDIDAVLGRWSLRIPGVA